MITTYQTTGELDNLRKLLKDLPEGEIVEVGVFEGGTAEIIADAYPDKTIYLFDTFEGLPNDLVKDDPEEYYMGHCKGELETAQEYLKGKNVKFYKGRFPDTSKPIKDMKFAFVHLDVDIYTATKDALKFFIPKMVKGGKILIHDYPAHKGVKRAVDELIKVKVLGKRQALYVRHT